MAVLQFVAPILTGKFDQWKELHATMAKGGKNEKAWKAQMRRYGIQRQYASLQKTPMGDFVVLFFEGDEPGAMMAGLGSSDNEFDKFFAQQIKDIHGIDVNVPPPGPISELVLEYNA